MASVLSATIAAAIASASRRVLCSNSGEKTPRIRREIAVGVCHGEGWTAGMDTHGGGRAGAMSKYGSCACAGMLLLPGGIPLASEPRVCLLGRRSVDSTIACCMLVDNAVNEVR